MQKLVVAPFVRIVLPIDSKDNRDEWPCSAIHHPRLFHRDTAVGDDKPGRRTRVLFRGIVTAVRRDLRMEEMANKTVNRGRVESEFEAFDVMLDSAAAEV